MKEFRYKIVKVSALVTIVLLSACSDEFLNPEPNTAIDENGVFDSYQTAESALIGAYDELSHFHFEGHWLPIMSDIMGEDILINSVDNWGWFVEVYQLNVLPNYSYNTFPWRQAYRVIHNANLIITKSVRIPNATEEQIDELVGQALVLRAFSMLKLVQAYAPSYIQGRDNPGIMNPNTLQESDSPDLPRATVGEVYDQIVTDLLGAIGLLDDNSDPGFFDQKAAQAILARTYLDMNMWQEARDMAKAAYDGVTLARYDQLLTGFYESNSETLFSVAFTQDDNNIYMSIPSFYWPVAGYSSMRANSEFVDLFSPSDTRRNQFHWQDDIDADNWLILKFGHNESVGNAERISIRASEMYLIEAECEAELGNYSAAQDAMFAIQQRSNPSAQKSSATGQQLIDEVLIERRKELFGEGFRWNDIKRRNLPFVRTSDHWVDSNINPEDDEYYKLVFPIPQSEIDTNEAINDEDQNEGY